MLLTKEMFISSLVRHMEERKALELLGMRDIYPQNNSVRISQEAFVKFFGKQETEGYTEKYNIMRVRVAGIAIYAMVRKEE